MEDEEYLIAPVQSSNVIRKTGYRWIILTIFSLLSMFQNTLWDTWGPISPSATAVFGFTDHDYYLLSNWSSVGVLSMMPIFMWSINKYGARLPVVVSSFLVASASGVRCLPVMGLSRKILIHFSQLLNAFAGCAVLSLAPLISNTWFPFSERIFATSIMLCVGTAGIALSYAIGPFVIDSPATCSTNVSTTVAPHTTTQSEVYETSDGPFDADGYTMAACIDNTEIMRKQLNCYLYVEFGVGAVIFLATLLLFRNKPTSAPNMSATQDRLNMIDGLKFLLKNRYYWTVVISLAFNQGAYFGWFGVVTVLLYPHGISEKHIAVAVVSMSISGLVFGVLLGFLTDRFKGRIKWILFACYCGMFIVYLYLVTIIMGWFESIKFTYGGFMASFSILGALSYTISPFGLEMAADIAYPVNEGIATAIVVWISLFFMSMYLLILNAVPANSGDIASYLFLAFTGVSAATILLASESATTRSTLDNSCIQNDQISSTQAQQECKRKNSNPDSFISE